MATSTSPSKRFYGCAAKQKATGLWDNTPQAVGALDELFVSSDGDPGLKQEFKPFGGLNSVVPKDGDLGASEAVDFSPEFGGDGCGLQYEMGANGSLIAGLFGTTYVPQPLFLIDATNNKVDFDEGSTELTGTVTSGSYTAATLATAIKTAMDDAGALTYTVSFSTTTAKFTISAATTFSLHWNTGTNKAVDISTICGYSDAADDDGASTYTSDTVAIGVAYVHHFAWADEGADFFTFATERPGDIWEVPSCVPTKLTLKPGSGFLQGSISLRGNHLNNTSTTNEATELDAITKAAEGNIIRFQDGVFRINAQSGDALDSGDNLELSDFENNLERTKDALQVLGGSHIAEPAESATLLGSLKIKLPHETGAAATWFAAFTAKTAQKAELIFTGSTISGTHTYSFTTAFPRLMLKIAPGVKLEDIISGELEFLILEATAAPTGMTETLPYIDAVNVRPTAYVD